MKKLLSVLLAVLISSTAFAYGDSNRAEWRFSKNKEKKGVAQFIETGTYNATVGIKSAKLSFRHKGKVVNGELLNDKGYPTAIAAKGDYWLFEVPVTNLEAGTVVDIFLPITSADKAEESFAFEYLDGKKWLPVVATQADGTNVTTTASLKHPRRLWHAVKLTKPIESGAIAFRLRRVAKQSAVATIACPSPRGQQPQIVIYNNKVARDTVKMLFLGNSYTYYHTYPMIFKEIAWHEGHYADCNIFISGGYTMKAHLANKYSTEQVDKGGYDYVMLQDQSIQPTLNGTADDYGAAEQMTKMVNRVRASSPSANVCLEITWGRKFGNNNFGKKYEHLIAKYPQFYADYDAMQNRLIEVVTAEAEQNNAKITPVGYAWQIVMHERPDINLYHTDNHHQSYAGSYLSAAVAYLTVYGEAFGPNPANCKLKPSVAAYLRSVAERVVLKGEKWNQK